MKILHGRSHNVFNHDFFKFLDLIIWMFMRTVFLLKKVLLLQASKRLSKPVVEMNCITHFVSRLCMSLLSDDMQLKFETRNAHE